MPESSSAARTSLEYCHGGRPSLRPLLKRRNTDCWRKTSTSTADGACSYFSAGCHCLARLYACAPAVVLSFSAARNEVAAFSPLDHFLRRLPPERWEPGYCLHLPVLVTSLPAVHLPVRPRSAAACRGRVRAKLAQRALARCSECSARERSVHCGDRSPRSTRKPVRRYCTSALFDYCRLRLSCVSDHTLSRSGGIVSTVDLARSPKRPTRSALKAPHSVTIRSPIL